MGKRNGRHTREQPYPSRRGRTSNRVPFLAAGFSPRNPVLTIRIAAPYPYPIALFLLKSKAEEKPCPAVFIPRFSRA